jgi:UDP-N-acetylmuramyl pentapeptide phosphotransferase/UDP-N-acetylglucosamine-1-phosphate transferase
MLPVVALLLLPLWLPQGLRAAAIAVLSVLGAVGLLDDLYASRHQARGLRGHLRALLSGRLTTGGVKAIGGLAAGVAAGAILAPGRPAMIALDALLIALCANSVNLLDLRPGRALKGFAVLCLVALIASPGSFSLLGPMLALALVLAPAELAGRVMLGDVGANVLGGIAGVGLVVALSPWQRLVSVLALLAFHFLCERVSFSELVRRNRAMAWFDAIGAGHLPPLPAREAIP